MLSFQNDQPIERTASQNRFVDACILLSVVIMKKELSPKLKPISTKSRRTTGPYNSLVSVDRN
jgi:hypothetical protein